MQRSAAPILRDGFFESITRIAVSASNFSPAVRWTGFRHVRHTMPAFADLESLMKLL